MYVNIYIHICPISEMDWEQWHHNVQVLTWKNHLLHEGITPLWRNRAGKVQDKPKTSYFAREQGSVERRLRPCQKYIGASLNRLQLITYGTF